MKDLAILRKALDVWGEESQLNMTIEESAELIYAVCKLRRDVVPVGYDRYARLHEEIADVALMVEQMQVLFYGVDWAALRQERIDKLHRLLDSPIITVEGSA